MLVVLPLPADPSVTPVTPSQTSLRQTWMCAGLEKPFPTAASSGLTVYSCVYLWHVIVTGTFFVIIVLNFLRAVLR